VYACGNKYARWKLATTKTSDPSAEPASIRAFSSGRTALLASLTWTRDRRALIQTMPAEIRGPVIFLILIVTYIAVARLIEDKLTFTGLFSPSFSAYTVARSAIALLVTVLIPKALSLW
jgi:hypothetical protein